MKIFDSAAGAHGGWFAAPSGSDISGGDGTQEWRKNELKTIAGFLRSIDWGGGAR